MQTYNVIARQPAKIVRVAYIKVTAATEVDALLLAREQADGGIHWHHDEDVSVEETEFVAEETGA